MSNVQPVLQATADLIHAIHTTEAEIPQEISLLADTVVSALTEYQLGLDYAQMKRTNYRVAGKKRNPKHGRYGWDKP